MSPPSSSPGGSGAHLSLIQRGKGAGEGGYKRMWKRLGRRLGRGTGASVASSVSDLRGKFSLEKVGLWRGGKGRAWESVCGFREASNLSTVLRAVHFKRFIHVAT